MASITVPLVIGDTLSGATAAIVGAGFTLGVVSSRYFPTVARGLVFEQDPPPYLTGTTGDPVNITLSLGPQYATVPDVLGLTTTAAGAALAAAGLVTGGTFGVMDPDTPIGNVSSQSVAAGTQLILGSVINLGISFLAPEFDVDATVISQYANSPTLLSLIEDFGQWFDPTADIQNFYLTVWNLDTAIGFGLDIWGIILGVSRVIPLPGTNGAFGFDNSDLPLDWEDFGNVDNAAAGGPFYSGEVSTGSYRLGDGPYLTLLLTKALANICQTTAPGLNAIISNLFAGRGRAYVQDLGHMHMAYNFNFALTSIELAILRFSGVLAHPGGVGFTINVIPVSPENFFGFQEAGSSLEPFDFGVFYNGS